MEGCGGILKYVEVYYRMWRDLEGCGGIIKDVKGCGRMWRDLEVY